MRKSIYFTYDFENVDKRTYFYFSFKQIVDTFKIVFGKSRNSMIIILF